MAPLQRRQFEFRRTPPISNRPRDKRSEVLDSVGIGNTKDDAPVLAAQYIRVSTEHQQYSPEFQAETIRRFAYAHGLQIVREYSDEGRSSLTLSERKGLQQLLNDVRGESCGSTARNA